MTGLSGLLAGSAATLLAIRWARRLIQFPWSLPVDIHPFLQRVDLEEARAAFNGQGFDTKFEGWGWWTRRRLELQLRRDLHTRIAESRAYLDRMAANVLAIQRHADNDPQRGKEMQRDQAMHATRRTAHHFRFAAGVQFFKINILNLILRFDRLSLVATGRVAAWWLSGIDHVFDLYERVKSETTVYVRNSQEAEEVRTNM